MMPFWETNETMEQYKKRLIAEIEAGTLTAEDAVKCYEGALTRYIQGR